MQKRSLRSAVLGRVPRRVALTFVAAAAVLGHLSASPAATSAATAAPPSTKPNIVFILTDDMRLDDLRYLPHVRRLLGATGRTYTEAIAPDPLCCPSRASLVTGQFGQNNGVKHNAGRWGGYRALRHKSNTIARWLTDAGYQTLYTGKYLNGYDWEDGRTKADTPRPPGWTVWDPVVKNVYSYWSGTFWNGDKFHGRYKTDVFTQRTVSAIDRFHASRKPFFLFVNQLAPHSTELRNGSLSPAQYEPRYARYLAGVKPPNHTWPSYNSATSGLPSSLNAPAARAPRAVVERWASTWRDRLRALQSVDRSVARIVAELKATGELDNTYLVFSSDNGYELGEHRRTGKNVVFKESLRIPLLVRGPGIAAGTTSRTPVSLVDLAPTFLEWAGAHPGRVQDGLPLDQINPDRRDSLLIQTGDKVADSTPGWWFRGVKTSRYTYATYAGNGAQGLLYDHSIDPYETTNRYDDPAYRAVRAELQRRTEILERCAGADCNQVFGPVPEPQAS